MNRPFRTVAFGLLLVFLDFRFNAWDLLPDALGYGMVFVALGAHRSVELLRWARIPAALSTVLSLPALLGLTMREHSTVTSSGGPELMTTHSTTTWEINPLGEWLEGATGLLTTGLVILICLGIRALVGAETPFGRRAYGVTKLIAVLWLPIDVLASASAAVSETPVRHYTLDGLSAAPLALLVVAALVAMIVSVVVLLRFLLAADAAVVPAVAETPLLPS